MDYPYIKHHGILGMRWGVRRYQNKDGSLTAAGKKRRALGETGESNDPKKENSAPAKKSIKDLTDAELRERVSRLELEKRYRDLETASNAQVNSGKKFVNSYLSPAAKKILWDTSVDVAAQGVKRIMSKKVNDAITKQLNKK